MREERQPCVYILAGRHYGTLYIGVTSNLIRRRWQHRNDVLSGFTQRHHVHRLVHFELFGNMERAITREKQLKREFRVTMKYLPPSPLTSGWINTGSDPA